MPHSRKSCLSFLPLLFLALLPSAFAADGDPTLPPPAAGHVVTPETPRTWRAWCVPPPAPDCATESPPTGPPSARAEPSFPSPAGSTS